MKAPEEGRKITTKDELINEFVDSRAEVFRAVKGLTDEDMTRLMNDSGMTVKKILIHWIAWDDLEIQRTGRFFAGETISMWPDENQDAFNEQAFAKWEDKSIEEVREAFYKSTIKVENLLRRFTQPQLFMDKGITFEQEKDGKKVIHIVNPAWFLVEGDHDRNHAREIDVWKKEIGIGGPE